MNKLPKSTKKRRDAEFNREAVRTAFINALKQTNGRRPTVKELCRASGLSSKTIISHLETIDISGVADPSFKILSDDVILSVYRSAMKGNPTSAKLWFQLVHGWSEKTETKHSGEVQINNEPPVILQIMRRNENE